MARPVFQCQGPIGNCVIGGLELSWSSCTAYAMAMLIDAATDGAQRPKGCFVRRRVRVAERDFDLVISVRTGPNAIPVERALARVRAGRGFVLQGNNGAFAGKGTADHAIYVHAVKGGTDAAPERALVYDPQRAGERWIPWPKILRFAQLLRVDASGTRLGPGRFYAGFAPRRPTDVELAELPAPVPDDGVDLRFGAVRLPAKDRTRANPPAGRRVNVRKNPRRLDAAAIVDTLGRGELFVAWQRVDDGARPPGSASRTWYGNRAGTEWVHDSGLRRIGGRR
jgi:hypothetical protein